MRCIILGERKAAAGKGWSQEEGDGGQVGGDIPASSLQCAISGWCTMPTKVRLPSPQAELISVVI